MSDLKSVRMALCVVALLILGLPQASLAEETEAVICSEKRDFSHRKLDSREREDPCKAYRGKVMLVVNTASRCGFTYQYEGLEKIYQTYRDRGLVVVGFPSNDFANQEPGSEESIKGFCQLTYGVEFPMYAKTRVVGEDAHPFYRALTEASGSAPQWNFHKYLIDRSGRVVDNYSSSTKPESPELKRAIEGLL